MREKLSAVVVAYNRAPLIGTALRALAFADEVIMVDKSSPTTRGRLPRATPTGSLRSRGRRQWKRPALSQWHNARTTGSSVWMTTSASAPRRSVSSRRSWPRRAPTSTGCCSAITFSARTTRQHIIGLNIRSACSAAGRFLSTTRCTTGPVLHSDNVLRVAPETGVAIHHLSHQDVTQWIEKTNRYTSRFDRQRVADDGLSLARFAHGRNRSLAVAHA